MTHQDKSTRQYRVWLRRDTVQNVKLLAVRLGRDDWNLVLDDLIRMGYAYFNEAAKLELVDWDDSFKFPDLTEDLRLRILRGNLPQPKE